MTVVNYKTKFINLYDDYYDNLEKKTIDELDKLEKDFEYYKTSRINAPTPVPANNILYNGQDLNSRRNAADLENRHKFMENYNLEAIDVEVSKNGMGYNNGSLTWRTIENIKERKRELKQEKTLDDVKKQQDLLKGGVKAFDANQAITLIKSRLVETGVSKTILEGKNLKKIKAELKAVDVSTEDGLKELQLKLNETLCKIEKARIENLSKELKPDEVELKKKLDEAKNSKEELEKENERIRKERDEYKDKVPNNNEKSDLDKQIEIVEKELKKKEEDKPNKFEEELKKLPRYLQNSYRQEALQTEKGNWDAKNILTYIGLPVGGVALLIAFIYFLINKKKENVDKIVKEERAVATN